MPSSAVVFLSVLFIYWGVSLLNASGRLRSFQLIKKNSSMSLAEALNACRSENTDLVTIYDEEDHNESFRGFMNKGAVSAWIGATSCKWSNGHLATFVNFGKTFTEDNYCAAINTNGSWDFSDCNSTQNYFICYDQDHEQQSQNYSLIPENRTWFEAQIYCRKNHTDLVTIRDETENEQVKEKLNGNNSFWIGLRYDNNRFNWFDGGHSNYTADIKLSHGCFTYLAKETSKKYNWLRVMDGDYGAVCYKSFIHVSEYNMSWEKALDYCEINDSQLLSIHSEKEQDQTEVELKKRNISGPVWVGLRQSRVFGFWIWINGIQVGNWNHWKGGRQPEYSHHCGAMEKDNGEYKWCDKDCRSQFMAVCVKK